jgi:PIF1-like helicase/Helix-turn-helix domain
MEQISQAAHYTLQFINQTQQNIFLTGKAGTGKTTLLHQIIKTTHKNTVVVAPTGIAALNAGGVTIHSMFQLPFGGFIPDNKTPEMSDYVKFESRATLYRHFKMSGLKKAVIRNMELLIIDEVSMLRADLLDAIDFMLQSVRKKSGAFGGVQVLFIGDLLQLPPIIKDEEWKILRQYYKGKFFFHSHVLQLNPPLYIELSKIYRQTNDTFISVLNNLRNNQISENDIKILNQYVKPNFDSRANKGYITLTTHNNKADIINANALKELDTKTTVYKPDITGDFPDKIYPIDAFLELKVGAQIMFIKNDLSFEKRYFNGKMGVVKSLSDGEIVIHFQEENIAMVVDKYEWQNIRYTVNQSTKEIEEEVLGTFVHYPIKLAWAITVHKSQGLTFDKAALDVSQVFLPGQAYVALSRLRSLDGLVLLSPLQMNGISNDFDVMDYAQNRADEATLADSLAKETQGFILQYLKTSFDWHDLAQEWRNHQYSYNEKAENSEKSKHALWAKKQAVSISEIQELARKFLNQLDKLFSTENIDYQFIKERVHAAYDYFFKPIDTLVFETLWKIEEIKQFKKVKAYYEELSILEELQIKAALQLMKSKMLLEAVVSGTSISKENLTSSEMRNYKANKIETIHQKFKALKMTLIEDSVQIDRYKTAKESKNGTKKSTIQETFELWQQKNSIKEIASIRVLTTQTIAGHMVKLIENGSITLTEVLPEERIIALKAAFEGYVEDSLSNLKEIVGDNFSWDELKMYKASLILHT